MNLINGFTTSLTKPFSYAKTPSGIVMLRGYLSGGVKGQSAGQLPAGSRPSFEVLDRRGLRITAGGNIVTSAGHVNGYTNEMFVAGR